MLIFLPLVSYISFRRKLTFNVLWGTFKFDWVFNQYYFIFMPNNIFHSLYSIRSPFNKLITNCYFLFHLEKPDMTTPFVPRINCDHDINFQEPGHIESPNFGIGNYFPRLRCVWRLFAPDEYIIRLHFVSFYIEYSQSCQYDALTVTEGSVAGGQVLAALWTNIPG